jgi:hypothetical protein
MNRSHISSSHTTRSHVSCHTPRARMYPVTHHALACILSPTTRSHVSCHPAISPTHFIHSDVFLIILAIQRLIVKLSHLVFTRRQFILLYLFNFFCFNLSCVILDRRRRSASGVVSIEFYHVKCQFTRTSINIVINHAK